MSALSKVLPHALPLSNNHLLPIEKTLAFIDGLLCGARKLTHMAYLRRDPVVLQLIGVRRVASQSVLSRFFQGFDSAGTNLRCFRQLWRWCLNRLPRPVVRIDQVVPNLRGQRTTAVGKNANGVIPDNVIEDMVVIIPASRVKT